MFIAFDAVILILENKSDRCMKTILRMHFTVKLTIANQNGLNYLKIKKWLYKFWYINMKNNTH